MRSFNFIPRWLILLLIAGWICSPLLHAELTDEQKKELFRKSHAAAPSPAPHHTHHKTPPAHGATHPAATGSSASHPGKKKTHHAAAHPGSTPPPHHESSAISEPSPVHPAPGNVTPAEAVSHPAEPQSVSHAAGVIASPVSPASSEAISLPHGATPSAPITIEKSGVDQAQGLEPARASSGLFGWLFGGGGSHRSYNYLSASTRAAIDHAPVRRGRWKYIIVHNSGTREGNARIFDIYHFRVRHMVNGLAYHFVIGDGHGSGDGQIEIGHRWTAQLNGGHVASDYLNDISLGICLVGDFNRDVPTKAQIGALEELISYLRDRVGKTQGRRAIIYAHKEINPRPTDCPGERFPYSWLHAKFR